MPIRQLIINTGSTTTKLGVSEDKNLILTKNLTYGGRLSRFTSIYDQIPLRTEDIRHFLEQENLDLRTFDGIMCRGGMVWGIGMGCYRVGTDLCKALRDERYCSVHASNLSGLIGKDLADQAGLSAYIYDAVTAASLPTVAKITGFPNIVRRSSCHVLNAHAVALRHAERYKLAYEKLRLLVAHLGGGISFCVIDQGNIVDSIGDDDGAFSPERSGFTQIIPIIKMCYSGRYRYEDILAMVRGKGGLSAYLGTSDAKEIEAMIRMGDRRAEILYEAQAYQIAKGIGELSIVLRGDCDGILLTGGLARSRRLVHMVEKYVDFIAPVYVYPGEFEMQALVNGGYRVLTGLEEAREFSFQRLERNNSLIFE